MCEGASEIPQSSRQCNAVLPPESDSTSLGVAEDGQLGLRSPPPLLSLRPRKVLCFLPAHLAEIQKQLW